MKKLTILFLVLVLAACSTPAPAPTEAAPTQVPPEPVVVTVVVEPTQAPAEPAPTQAPVEPVVVTVVVEATQAPAQPAPTEVPAQPAAPATDGAIALDVALGRGVFNNMTMSSDSVTLRCFPRDITFNVTTPNADIKDVMFYYRVVDGKRLYPSEWKAFGKMVANGGGNFTLTFSGEDVHPDLRIDGGWLDFQFVGLAKSGDAIDRSDKFESLVKYTFDCP